MTEPPTHLRLGKWAWVFTETSRLGRLWLLSLAERATAAAVSTGELGQQEQLQRKASERAVGGGCCNIHTSRILLL